MSFGDTFIKRTVCEFHVQSNSNYGHGYKDGLPIVNIRLEELTRGVNEVLEHHGGSLPLASLPHCYSQVVGKVLDRDSGGGVLLEHLLQAVKDVAITTIGGVRKLVDTTVVKVEVTYSDLIGPPPAIANKFILFTREVLDLLKSLPESSVPLFQFIPTYRHVYGKHCRVTDLGFNKLAKLLESIPHVVQLVGESPQILVVMSHRAQVRRFTNDIIKILKSGQEKVLKLSDLPAKFEMCFMKPFIISDYGVCHILDIFKDVPENTFIFEEIPMPRGGLLDVDFVVGLFRRDQTPEEISRTKVFSKEVVELISHSQDLFIAFNKFIPVYHQHFGRQCRVASFGVSKLMELFEMIYDTVEVKEVKDERIVQLTKKKMIAVVGEQVERVVRNFKGKIVPLVNLNHEYNQVYDRPLPLVGLGIMTEMELVELLHHWVRVVPGRECPQVTLVDKGYIRTVVNNVRKLLGERENGAMEIRLFFQQIADRFGSIVDLAMLNRDLSSLVVVRGDRVGLTDLQLVARDIQLLLGDVGKLPVAELENQYEAKFGRKMPLVQCGFDNVGELLAALGDILSVRGRGIRKLVCLHNLPHTVNSSYPHPTATTASFSGRGFDMIRQVSPAPYHPSISSQSHLRPAPFVYTRSSEANSYQLLQNPPLISVGSPPGHQQLITAAPNSPMTPTYGRSYNFPTIVGVSTSTILWQPDTSISSSPTPTMTFQQHMMKLSPSPLIVPTGTPYIVQPISRTSHFPEPDGFGYNFANMDIII